MAIQIKPYIVLWISLYFIGTIGSVTENCKKYLSRQVGSNIHSRQLMLKTTSIKGSAKVVSFQCLSKEFYLNKDVYLICYSNGQWSDTLPLCLKRCPEITAREITSNSKYLNATNAIVKDTEDRRQNTTVYLTCATDGYEPETTPYLTCLSNSSWDREVPLCKRMPLPFETKLIRIYVPLTGVLFILLIINIAFVICRRRRNRAKDFSEKNEGRHEAVECFFKVWCSRRRTRKIIKAATLDELKQNATNAFHLTGKVSIVLEEDGTELETDESLRVYADKILMVLSDDETWMKKSDQNNTAMDTSKFTFDVCSFDRKYRKLVLADGLEDLKQQGSLSFSYSVSAVCLESDGTLIDEDVKLFGFANQVFMLLGLTHIWAPNYSGFITDKDSVCGSNTYLRTKGRKMFKIKALKGEEKIAVVASNVVELHLLAAKMLQLDPPIQIHTEEGTIVVSDSDLTVNQGRLLIVSEMNNLSSNFSKLGQGYDQSPKQHVNSYYPNLFSSRQSADLTNYSSIRTHFDMRSRSPDGRNRYNYEESAM